MMYRFRTKARVIISLLIGIVVISIIVINGCKKTTETSSPIIALKGNNPLYLSLNTTYIEPGYLAHDITDGDISAQVTISGVNAININMKGTYLIIYSVTNSAGIISSATRSVFVINNADSLSGNFNVIDTCVTSGVIGFADSVKASSTVNDYLTFYNFAGFNDSISGIFHHLNDTILFTQNQNLGGGKTLISAYGIVVLNDTSINGNIVVKRNIDLFYQFNNGVRIDTCVSHYKR